MSYRSLPNDKWFIDREAASRWSGGIKNLKNVKFFATYDDIL